MVVKMVVKHIAELSEQLSSRRSDRRGRDRSKPLCSLAPDCGGPIGIAVLATRRTNAGRWLHRVPALAAGATRSLSITAADAGCGEVIKNTVAQSFCMLTTVHASASACPSARSAPLVQSNSLSGSSWRMSSRRVCLSGAG
jgi:hypothetical protein